MYMNRLERVYKIDQMLQERKVVAREVFLRELEVSLATFKRDLEHMRDRLNAPVVWDRDLNGYRFADEQKGTGPRYQLPGLWFNQEEATALVTMQHLLSSIDQGRLLAPHIEPLMSRIDSILGSGETPSKELRKRIKVVNFHSRQANAKFFSEVGYALLNRKQIHMKYYARGKNETTERDVSPQRLCFYQANWYVDGWCHLKKELRTFAIDGIQSIELLETKALEMSAKDLDAHLASGYGIFSGADVKTAKLKFSPERARWVAAENWHGQQISSFDQAGNYLLEVPYSDDRELMLDIMRHGGHVEVLGPKELRKKVAQAHLLAAEKNN
jgi:predicted DNA-binding transcriptional regulator YafY